MESVTSWKLRVGTLIEVLQGWSMVTIEFEYRWKRFLLEFFGLFGKPCFRCQTQSRWWFKLNCFIWQTFDFGNFDGRYFFPCFDESLFWISRKFKPFELFDKLARTEGRKLYQSQCNFSRRCSRRICVSFGRMHSVILARKSENRTKL